MSDYFDMLRMDLTGAKPIKARYYQKLAQQLDGRNERAVEAKHQNVSAAMRGLGQPIVRGLLPRWNIQMSLVDAVWRKIQSADDWFTQAKTGLVSSVREAADLYIGPPPTHSNAPEPEELKDITRILQKYDVAARDEANRALGRAGEELVLEHERHILRAQGRDDLAQSVVWTSQERGDGEGYDIFSYEPDGKPRLIEVKTTNGWERTPFHISRNELAVADENRDIWHLLRLYDFAREPRAFALRPPLEAHVALTPTSFLASLH